MHIIAKNTKDLLNTYQALPLQLKASFWFLICSFVQKGISIITTPIFTRLLTPAEYGLFGVFTSWLSIATVFVTLNLFYGVYMQGLVKFETYGRKYSSAMQGLCLTMCIVWSVIYFFFDGFWNDFFSLSTVQVTAMLLTIWTSSVFNFWATEQRINYKYLKLIIITIVIAVFKPLVGIFLVLHAEDKVTARILGLAAVEFVVYIWLFLAQMWRGKQFFSWKIWKYALLFNIPLVPHYLSGAILNAADRIMIEKIVGVEEAGVYTLAYSVSLIMTIFNTSLLQTIEPWLYKKIKSHDVNDIARVAYPAFIAIASVNIMLIACAPEIIAIFAPKEYHDAIWIIPPVAVSSYFMFAYAFFAAFEFYYEKTYLITLATTVGAIFKIFLNYILIDMFGYYAAGYATLLCFMVYAALHYLFMKIICKKYMENAQVYSTRKLLLITFVFMFFSFLFLCTYKSVVVRYSCVLMFGIGLFIYRSKILDIIKNLRSVKQ